MSQVSDYTLSNIGFSAFRTELNSILNASNTLNAGSSAPGSVAAGSLWLDTTNSTTPTLKFYDGSDQISLCTFNYSANTVNWLDSTVSSDLVNDTSVVLEIGTGSGYQAAIPVPVPLRFSVSSQRDCHNLLVWSPPTIPCRAQKHSR